MNTIYLATDHAGFDLKERIKVHLESALFEVRDMGATTLDPDDDYPDYIILAAREVAKDPHEARAIVFGGSGQGEAMMANRLKGVRAAVYYGGPREIIDLSREHNNANVLSIGARFVSFEDAREVVERWLATPFTGQERHARRIAKLDTL